MANGALLVFNEKTPLHFIWLLTSCCIRSWEIKGKWSQFTLSNFLFKAEALKIRQKWKKYLSKFGSQCFRCSWCFLWGKITPTFFPGGLSDWLKKLEISYLNSEYVPGADIMHFGGLFNTLRRELRHENKTEITHVSKRRCIFILALLQTGHCFIYNHSSNYHTSISND